MLIDGLIFTDDEDKVIFNHHSFCELIKHIMVKYAGKTFEEADLLVRNSFLMNEPESYDHVVFYTHELQFHWAMLIAHGDMYWLKGIPSDYNDFNDSYLTWEKDIMTQYNIKESYQYIEF